MVSVTLTPQEMMMAAYAGTRRAIASIQKGRQPAYGCTEIWGTHIEGAAGEMAFAKAAGIYWDAAFDTFSKPDVGSFQVRTRSRSDYELLVRQCDADDERFVLVTGTMPEFSVRGWILGADAKQERWLRTHGGRPPAYFVPHSELQPIEKIFDPTVARLSKAG